MLPVLVTDDPAAGRERVAKALGPAGQLPSYRAILDRQGLADPEDVIIAGDQTAVERLLRQMADAGVTDFFANLFGSADEQARTMELLAALNRPAATAR